MHQDVNVCINCDNVLQESKRCGFAVDNVIQCMAFHGQIKDREHIQISKVVPLDSYEIFDL